MHAAVKRRSALARTNRTQPKIYSAHEKTMPLTTIHSWSASWTGGRSYREGSSGRDRGSQGSSFPRTNEQKTTIGVQDSHARNKKPGGASARAAAPPPAASSSISYAGAHGRRCARTAADRGGWGRRRAPEVGRTGPRFPTARQFRCATASGAGHCHVPASGWCQIYASAVVAVSDCGLPARILSVRTTGVCRLDLDPSRIWSSRACSWFMKSSLCGWGENVSPPRTYSITYVQRGGAIAELRRVLTTLL